MKIKIFDSTLRDGAQGEGISFSVTDKLKIVKVLDDLGIHYIESGNPGSNEKDRIFFKEVKKMTLKQARLVAFGSTRRKGIEACEDDNVLALLEAQTEVVCIFGKSWDLHVEEILKTSLEENLRMIEDTVAFFKEKGREVVFDAEHFFDGYKANPGYAIKTLESAREAGADVLVLCDTNGGTYPTEIQEIVLAVGKIAGTTLGIHVHDDMGLAVANSLLAVEAGATHVQGTLTGFGERCGNANLSAIIPNLQLKRGFEVLTEAQLENLARSAREVNNIANIPLRLKLDSVVALSEFASGCLGWTGEAIPLRAGPQDEAEVISVAMPGDDLVWEYDGTNWPEGWSFLTVYRNAAQVSLGFARDDLDYDLCTGLAG